MGQKRPKPEQVTIKASVKKEETLPAERAAFLRSNEVEKQKLDREIAMLERKLGIKKDTKKRRKLNQAVEQEGFGSGFMDFIDGIEKKVKLMPEDEYQPKDYEFSDGEGAEEGDLFMEEGGSGSDQEGFDDISSHHEEEGEDAEDDEFDYMEEGEDDIVGDDDEEGEEEYEEDGESSQEEVEEHKPVKKIVEK